MFKKIKKWQIHQCGTTKLVVFILFFKTQVFFFVCTYVLVHGEVMKLEGIMKKGRRNVKEIETAMEHIR